MRTPRDPDWEARLRAAFAAQEFMALIGAEIVSAHPGEVTIALPVKPKLCQQHGYVHAGATWAIADSAAGFACQSLMGPEDGVLTIEKKINLLAPAEGRRLVARGRVERPGRLMVARADVVAELEDGTERPVATTLGTFMTMPGLKDRPAPR